MTNHFNLIGDIPRKGFFQSRLTTTRACDQTPLPLIREMTPDEVSAKAQKAKREAPVPDSKVGLGGALRLREMLMEAAGQETTSMKKKRKKEECNDKSSALKIVKGGHLLK